MQKLWIFCILMCCCYAQSRQRTTFKLTPTPKSTTTKITKRFAPADFPKTLCDNNICSCNKPQTTVTCRCKENVQEITIAYYENSPVNSLPANVQEFTVERCKKVKIQKYAIFRAPKLKLFKVDEVDSLDIETNGFYHDRTRMVGSQKMTPFSAPLDFAKINETDISDLISESTSSLTIDIRDTKIRYVQAHAFEGCITAIEFRNCKFFYPIISETFFNLQRLEVLLFNQTVLHDIETNAFSQVTTQYFALARSHVDSVRENAVVINTTQVAVIRHCTIDSIRSEGVQISTPKIFKFTNNTVSTIFRHAIEVVAQGPVTIEHCQFQQVNGHAFHYISSARKNDDLHFRGNTFVKFDQGALHLNETYNPAYIQLDPLFLPNDYCTCNSMLFSRKLLTKNPTRKRRELDHFFTRNTGTNTDYSGRDYDEVHGLAPTADEKEEASKDTEFRILFGTAKAKEPLVPEHTDPDLDAKRKRFNGGKQGNVDLTGDVDLVPTKSSTASSETPPSSTPKFRDLQPGRSEDEDSITMESILISALHCVSDTKTIPLQQYQMKFCDADKNPDGSGVSLNSLTEQLLYIGLPISILLVLGIGLGLCIHCCRTQKRKNHKNKEETLNEAQLMELLGMPRKASANSSKLANINSAYENQSTLPSQPSLTTQSSWVLAVPDAKVYKETEVQVVVEYAKPLEMNYRDSCTE